MEEHRGRKRKKLIVDEVPAGNYLTVAQVAALTNSHIHTVQARLRDGTIPGKKLGGIWRIYPDAILNEKVEVDLNIQKEGEKQ